MLSSSFGIESDNEEHEEGHTDADETMDGDDFDEDDSHGDSDPDVGLSVPTCTEAADLFWNQDQLDINDLMEAPEDMDSEDDNDVMDEEEDHLPTIEAPFQMFHGLDEGEGQQFSDIDESEDDGEEDEEALAVEGVLRPAGVALEGMESFDDEEVDGQALPGNAMDALQGALGAPFDGQDAGEEYAEEEEEDMLEFDPTIVFGGQQPPIDSFGYAHGDFALT